MVKPTRGASSRSVVLASSRSEAAREVGRIEALASSKRGHYYDGTGGPVALLEEFIAGDEVTLDAAIVGGELVLAGIHDKARMVGPYFEEDYYTIPLAIQKKHRSSWPLRPSWHVRSIYARAAQCRAAQGCRESVPNHRVRDPN